jgi:DNA-binding winged helix-turn-helix (wHTH) protein
MRLSFGPFVFDRAARQLLTDGEPRPLEPKAYELLDLLISRLPGAVSKAEIRDRVWPKTFVSESTFSSLVSQVRGSLDCQRRAHVRPDVHGFGYAFEGEAIEDAAPRPAARASAHLEWEGALLRLSDGENLIGRDDDEAVRIDVAGVSRHHACITALGGRFTLEDLGSQNGIFLREERLTVPADAEDGDLFRLGQTKLVFRRVHASETRTEG